MRLKTFVATYLLFLFVLFSSVGIVSVHLTNSQVNMLKDKGAGQFQTIAHSLAWDIVAAWDNGGRRHQGDLSTVVADLVHGYARFYSRHNVLLSVVDMQLTGQNTNARQTEITFVESIDGHFILISGLLPTPHGNFLLNYSLDITDNIAQMRGIQQLLLISAAVFAIIAAFTLHIILSVIFKPLVAVAKASREIAGGKFDERIHIKGNNELARVATDFNQMAEKIEDQITTLEEEAENKQQFVDNFAHEVRTPLTSIYGYAEYMHKALLDEKEIIESTAYIMDEAQHIKHIANSLLELATIRNYIPLKKEILVSKLFDDVAQSMENSLQEKNVRLICSHDVQVLCAQEDLMKSLLLNLCTNALQACAPNEGVIHLLAKAEENGIVLRVSDNGCGIAAESLPKLTTSFYRVDQSRNRGSGGAGLGLALCKQIAQVHGAQLFIESKLGEGTVVKLKLTTSE
ncbi:MAG: HAMP domain-containing histidine kinase [Oscillospiraceae bacterium]|nr:HAMP domain-containing histidine kinase [Oscillospiraceae bacterium]